MIDYDGPREEIQNILLLTETVLLFEEWMVEFRKLDGREVFGEICSVELSFVQVTKEAME